MIIARTLIREKDNGSSASFGKWAWISVKKITATTAADAHKQSECPIAAAARIQVCPDRVDEVFAARSLRANLSSKSADTSGNASRSSKAAVSGKPL